jgi:hypothetical protein
VSAFLQLFNPDLVLDYPEVGQLPFINGCLWSYVSSDLLDGFVNYGDIVCAVAMSRYNTPEENREALANYGLDDPPHAVLADLTGDDIALLKYAGDENYWVFYYDGDVSDCIIGRFKARPEHSLVTALFLEWLGTVKAPAAPWRRLDPKMLQGWISWSRR